MIANLILGGLTLAVYGNTIQHASQDVYTCLKDAGIGNQSIMSDLVCLYIFFVCFLDNQTCEKYIEIQRC